MSGFPPHCLALLVSRAGRKRPEEPDDEMAGEIDESLRDAFTVIEGG